VTGRLEPNSGLFSRPTLVQTDSWLNISAKTDDPDLTKLGFDGRIDSQTVAHSAPPVDGTIGAHY
jgi:hypothetical protein